MSWLVIAAIVVFCLFGLFFTWPTDFVMVDHRSKRVSTKEHPWPHPEGYPYQIIGGPMMYHCHGFEVWTFKREFEGYRLIEDDYSDRLYFVPEDFEP